MPDNPSPTQHGSARKSDTGTQVAELKDLIIGYAKQETIDPLHTLGRYLGFGIIGSLMMGTGAALLLLALLRGLQEIEFFNDTSATSGGTYSWAPYVITATVGLVVVGIFISNLLKAIKKADH